MDDLNAWEEWTSCEWWGHNFAYGDSCLDCGEPKDDEESECTP